MKTAVITTGGLGTRLLTTTKGNPKTMLPLYDKSTNNNPTPLLRPLIELIFDNLYNCGFRKFCIIIGTKTKSSILNHMVPDSAFLNLLKKRNSVYDKRFIKTLSKLYSRINDCKINWIEQSTPMGFGDALLSARKFVNNDTFLLHTGDAYFPNYRFLSTFIRTYEKSKNSSACLIIQQKKSLKGYGIVQTRKKSHENIVYDVEEKPKKPKTNLAILPLYIFKPTIFNALQQTAVGHNKELQVTDAIKTLINWNEKIIAFKFNNKVWFDIGTPNNYFKALKYSYIHARTN